jgi:AcrR family transcriptional regulator
MSPRLRISETRPVLLRSYIRVHQRRRLIDAIVDLTVEQGYLKTTVSQIVKRARMARATFYENFDGKEDLFLAAVEVTVAEADVRVRAACEEAEPEWAGRVRAGLGAFLTFTDERAGAVRVCMVDAPGVPAGLVRYEAAARRYSELIRALAPADNGLPQTTEEMLVGGVASVIRRHFASPHTGQFIDLQPELIEFLAAPYRSAAPSHPRRGAQLGTATLTG